MWPNDLNSLLFILKSFGDGAHSAMKVSHRHLLPPFQPFEKGEDFNKRMAAHKKVLNKNQGEKLNQNQVLRSCLSDCQILARV